MTSNTLIASILRSITILLIQILVLKNASENVRYLEIYLYPLILILLPFRTPHYGILLIGFFTGLVIDAFYNTIGVHTFVCVFTAFIRPYLCQVMEPRGGYESNQSPNRATMGVEWYFQHVAILMFIHIFVLFIVSSLSFNFTLLLRIFYGFTVTMLLTVLHSYIFNPKI